MTYVRSEITRACWRFVYPLALVGHKLFGLSYKWVNVGIGAWRRDSFDPLWQHRWYGDEIDAMPDSVNLCGCRYDVSVAEGLVLFVSRDYCTRLCFERDPHDRYGFLWYLDGSNHVAVCHVVQAYEWIEAVYGGSHELKRPAVKQVTSN